MKFTITINGKTHDFNQSVMAQLLGDLHTITNLRMVVVVTAGFLEFFTNTLIYFLASSFRKIICVIELTGSIDFRNVFET